MNFDAEVRNIQRVQNDLEDRMKYTKELIDNFARAYSEAREFTSKFLDCCERYNISLVSIGVRTDKIKNCANHPFSCDGSVFAEGKYNGWPAIWYVVGEMGISGGAGNTDQHQISRKAKTDLIDGVYSLKNGVWEKVE